MTLAVVVDCSQKGEALLFGDKRSNRLFVSQLAEDLDLFDSARVLCYLTDREEVVCEPGRISPLLQRR
jgi:hypothetical protein